MPVLSHACDTSHECPVARNMEELLGEVAGRIEAVVEGELRRVTLGSLVAGHAGFQGMPVGVVTIAAGREPIDAAGDQIVREMHEERLVANGWLCAKNRMTEPQRLALPNNSIRTLVGCGTWYSEATRHTLSSRGLEIGSTIWIPGQYDACSTRFSPMRSMPRSRPRGSKRASQTSTSPASLRQRSTSCCRAWRRQPKG